MTQRDKTLAAIAGILALAVLAATGYALFNDWSARREFERKQQDLRNAQQTIDDAILELSSPEERLKELQKRDAESQKKFDDFLKDY